MTVPNTSLHLFWRLDPKPSPGFAPNYIYVLVYKLALILSLITNHLKKITFVSFKVLRFRPTVLFKFRINLQKRENFRNFAELLGRE